MYIYTSTRPMPYVYRVTHKYNGTYYIGYRCANNNPSHIDLPTYKTSSRLVKPFFDDFDWTIIAEFYDRDSAYDFEQYLIHTNWDDPLLLNASCYFGKGRFKTKPLTNKHKQAISKAQSRPKSASHRKKLSEANIGNHWYNDGSISVQAKICPPGFIAGRLVNSNECFTSDRARAAGKLNLGKKQTIITCPHCGKSGGNVLRRYHFDNCKVRSFCPLFPK